VAKNATLTVIDCCAPPPYQLVGHCIAFCATVAATVAYPNPATAGGAIHLFGEIYEKRLKIK
jgi:hypothetical protein